MNLHSIVRHAITAVNPDQTVILLASDGQRQGSDYMPVALWRPAVSVPAQVQPVPDKTLQWLLQTRQNTIWRDCYLYGSVTGLERATESGGDMLYFEGCEWQVDQVLEAWNATAGWTKVRCVQVRATIPPEIGATERPGEVPAWPG